MTKRYASARVNFVDPAGTGYGSDVEVPVTLAASSRPHTTPHSQTLLSASALLATTHRPRSSRSSSTGFECVLVVIEIGTLPLQGSSSGIVIVVPSLMIRIVVETMELQLDQVHSGDLVLTVTRTRLID